MSERVHAAEIVVIGAGPAGIAAAARAARAGRSVLLLDEGVRAGGQIWRHRDERTLPRRARRLLAELAGSGARTLHGASVVDLTADRVALLESGGEPAVVTATQAVILCTGARERFLPFPGWTLPGVVGVGGAQALLKQGLEVRGRRVVVAGSGPLLLPVAATLARAGARVALVAEQAPASRVLRFAAGLWRTPARLADAARYRATFARTPYRAGAWVVAAEGSDRVEAARLGGSAGDRWVPCDLLCVGYGLMPATELARLAGCALGDGAVQVDEAQRTTMPDIFCAGEPSGIAGVDAAITQGEIAGLAAAGEQVPPALLRRRDEQQRFAATLGAAFALREELRALAEPSTIVCRCEDVRYEQLAGCTSLREARLHTRTGMGPCQGRVCGAALEFVREWTQTAPRPPVAPARIGTLARGAS